MSANRFHVGGVTNTIGKPRAPAQPSMTPRARPKENAAAFASVGRATDEFAIGYPRIRSSKDRR
jgi:hypothetical protein